MEENQTVCSDQINGGDWQWTPSLRTEYDSKGPGNGQIFIRKDTIRKAVLFNRVEVLLWRIGAEGKDLVSQLSKLWLDSLQLNQLPVGNGVTKSCDKRPEPSVFWKAYPSNLHGDLS